MAETINAAEFEAYRISECGRARTMADIIDNVMPKYLPAGYEAALQAFRDNLPFWEVLIPQLCDTVEALSLAETRALVARGLPADSINALEDSHEKLRMLVGCVTVQYYAQFRLDLFSKDQSDFRKWMLSVGYPSAADGETDDDEFTLYDKA
jgi:hypothetical protein